MPAPVVDIVAFFDRAFVLLEDLSIDEAAIVIDSIAVAIAMPCPDPTTGDRVDPIILWTDWPQRR
jgi:hypothetical protein